MNNQENSLLGFLKKKTLFKQPPPKQGKRSRSKSRDSIIKKINDRDFQEEPKLYNNYSQKDFKQSNVPQRTFFEKDLQPPQQNNSLRVNKSGGGSQVNLVKSKNPQDKFDFTLQDRNNKLLNGLVSYASSFQSARLESAQCLQSMSLKLNTQISNINFRIDQFKNNMSRVLSNELKELKQKILHLVDEAFKETQRSIREYMKIEEQKLAGELLKVKDVLEKEYVKIETMKQEIHRPQWRKVAGQILASQLQKTVQEVVKKANSTDIGRWEMKNLSGQRLKTLQVELRDLVRLKQ